MKGLWIVLLLPLVVGPSRAGWLFVGDSLTLTQPGYIDVLEVGAERLVCYHLADCIVDWPVGRYDVVVIELGIHAVVGCDHLAGQDLDVFRRRYDQVVERAQGTASTVIAVTVPALWTGEAELARAQRYNAVIAEVAARRGVLVADAYRALAGCTGCVGEDGFHPNELGHRLIGEEVLGQWRSSRF